MIDLNNIDLSTTIQWLPMDFFIYVAMGLVLFGIVEIIKLRRGRKNGRDKNTDR